MLSFHIAHRLNLIGGNRLVLYDSSWNPATDKQAAARCWRDGNPRRCFTYRLISTGTIEEKMYQRQLSKEGLLGVIEDREQINSFSSVELRRLFTFDNGTTSDTHAHLDCNCVAATVSETRLFESDCNRLGPKRTAICSEYVVAELRRLQATSFSDETTDVKTRIANHFEAIISRLTTPNSNAAPLDSIPTLRREMDRVFIDLFKVHAEKANCLAEVENVRSTVQASWQLLVPKLYAMEEDGEEGADVKTADSLNDANAESIHTTGLSKDLCKPQVGMPTEEDLKNWSHHASVQTVDDEVLIAALKGRYHDLVSFVFTLETNAALIKQADNEKKQEAVAVAKKHKSHA